jgi:hypothetical protein
MGAVMELKLKYKIPVVLGLFLIGACSPEFEMRNTSGPEHTEGIVSPTGEEESPSEAKETPALEIPAVAAAIEDLAAILGISEEEIELVEFEGVEWPDSCLGYAQPDEFCLQVITPGFRIVLRVAGEEYIYHTDESGQNFRLVSGIVGYPVKPGVDINKPQVLIAAMRYLSETAGIPISEIRVVSIEETEWQDSCLGLGQANESCARIVVPGWNIHFESAGQIYELHADQSGDTIRLK